MRADDGERLQGRGFEKELLEDWDLDLEARRRHTERAIAAGGKPPKLVHNFVFSMPKETPPEKVLRAVEVFAREKFTLKHRYAIALHVDQGHPHVHVVVKAVSEQGGRLYIRKPTLREWRQDFAQYLRDLGVEANATERAVRGARRTTKQDGIHRAMLRGQSTHMRVRAEAVARELATDVAERERRRGCKRAGTPVPAALSLKLVDSPWATEAVMGTQQHDIIWVQTQLTVARWHLDAALSSTAEAALHNLQRSCHVCESTMNALSHLDVPSERREEFEQELAAIRSRLQTLREASFEPPANAAR